MEELLKNISSKDLEKLKLLLSFLPGNEPKEIVTLRVFAEEYSNYIKQNRSKAYYDSVISSFKHLTKFFGLQKSIKDIDLKETENFCSYLQQEVLNPASSSRGGPAIIRRGEGYRVYYKTIKAAFNKAVEWKYISENYFTRVKLPKKQKLAPVFLNSEQLIVISDQLKNETIKDIIIFAFHTGMRLDEIINLRWKNVDLENRVITVGDDNFTTKGRKQRFIPLSEEALEALLRMRSLNPLYPSGISTLEKWGECSGFVFCKVNGTKYTGDHISQSFKRACKTVGFDNAIHFHSLRHSFASNLVQKGVPLYTIKELLGHSSISTTEIYSHLNMETLREAVKKLDQQPHPNPLLSKEREKSPLHIFRINSAEK